MHGMLEDRKFLIFNRGDERSLGITLRKLLPKLSGYTLAIAIRPHFDIRC